MRLRKEISESYAVLHAVQECCKRLGISTPTSNAEDNLNLENIFMIDLCSGKAITTALCGALDDAKVGDSNNYFLAIDRLMKHQIPHFLTDSSKSGVHYLCRDIMAEEMFAEIEDIVRYQSEEHGRTCILVGMHLCGLLSERAIDLFDRTAGIKGIVLSPCCLPKKHEQKAIEFTKGKPGEEEDAVLYNYFKWAHYLKDRLEGYQSKSGVSDVKMYTDDEMHTEKNALILAVRNADVAP